MQDFLKDKTTALTGEADYGIGFFDTDIRNAYRLAEIIVHYMQSGFSDNAMLSRQMNRVELLLGLTLLRRIKRWLKGHFV